jgi:hypothetical protein
LTNENTEETLKSEKSPSIASRQARTTLCAQKPLKAQNKTNCKTLTKNHGLSLLSKQNFPLYLNNSSSLA